VDANLRSERKVKQRNAYKSTPESERPSSLNPSLRMVSMNIVLWLSRKKNLMKGVEVRWRSSCKKDAHQVSKDRKEPGRQRLKRMN